MSKRIRAEKKRIATTYLAFLNTIFAYETNLEKYDDSFLLSWNKSKEEDSASALLDKRYNDIESTVIFKITNMRKLEARAIYGSAKEDIYVRKISQFVQSKWAVTNDIRLVKKLAKMQNLNKYEIE